MKDVSVWSQSSRAYEIYISLAPYNLAIKFYRPQLRANKIPKELNKRGAPYS